MVPYIPVSYVYDQVAKDKVTLIGTLFFKGFPWLKQDRLSGQKPLLSVHNLPFF